MFADGSLLGRGLLFLVLYVCLVSVNFNIFRVSGSLSTPIAYVFFFFGEAVSTLPLVPVAWRNWTVKSPRRLASFVLLGLLMEVTFMAMRAAAVVMPLGILAAINVSGLLFVPALTALIRRRCVDAVDVGGVVAALIGLLLTTHPAFLFNEPVSAPGYAYALSAFVCVNILLYPYFFGATNDEHWSNFLVLRLLGSCLVACVCFGVAGGAAAVASTSSIGSAAMSLAGGISTIYRLAQQIGCYEMEAFDVGLAGMMGNIVNAAAIGVTSLMAMVFFGETLTQMEAVGVAIVFVTIVVVTLAKGLRKRKEEKGEDEREEEESLGEEEWEEIDAELERWEGEREKQEEEQKNLNVLEQKSMKVDLKKLDVEYSATVGEQDALRTEHKTMDVAYGSSVDVEQGVEQDAMKMDLKIFDVVKQDAMKMALEKIDAAQSKNVVKQDAMIVAHKIQDFKQGVIVVERDAIKLDLKRLDGDMHDEKKVERKKLDVPFSTTLLEQDAMKEELKKQEAEHGRLMVEHDTKSLELKKMNIAFGAIAGEQHTLKDEFKKLDLVPAKEIPELESQWERAEKEKLEDESEEK